MKKTFCAILLLFAYIWVVSTGHEQFVLDQSMRVYQAIVTWFDGAKVDFQVKQKSTPANNKRPRRWD
jgi:hypothetical protein